MTPNSLVKVVSAYKTSNGYVAQVILNDGIKDYAADYRIISGQDGAAAHGAIESAIAASSVPIVAAPPPPPAPPFDPKVYAGVKYKSLLYTAAPIAALQTTLTSVLAAISAGTMTTPAQIDAAGWPAPILS